MWYAGLLYRCSHTAGCSSSFGRIPAAMLPGCYTAGEYIVTFCFQACVAELFSSQASSRDAFVFRTFLRRWFCSVFWGIFFEYETKPKEHVRRNHEKEVLSVSFIVGLNGPLVCNIPRYLYDSPSILDWLRSRSSASSGVIASLQNICSFSHFFRPRFVRMSLKNCSKMLIKLCSFDPVPA